MKKGDLIQLRTSVAARRCRGIVLEDAPKDANFRTRIAVYMFYVPSWNNLKSGEIWDIPLNKLGKQYEILGKIETI